MKMRFLIQASIALFTTACASASAPNYTVKVSFTEDEDGMQLYMVDYDSGAKIDSTLVDGGVATFQGTIDTPVMTQLVLDGSRVGSFILEPGSTEINPSERKTISTGALNNALEDFANKQASIVEQYRAVPDGENQESERKAIEDKYEALTDSMFLANTSNPIGLYIFLQNAYDYDKAQLDSVLTKYPQFASSKRVNKLRTSLVNKEETSVGHKYKDFTITYNGETKRLSDYVGKGHYTLVDFWASWCGPCIRETKVIKELYAKYADKGLDILGVAVWDEPANTLKAIEQHQLPWQQIINAQTIPTDIYGISGIPCIILFDPEGNIISRDKQDQELIDDVEAAMAKYVDKDTE